MSKQKSIRLPDELMERLQALAKSEGRSLNNQITRLLETHPTVQALSQPDKEEK